MYLSDLTSAATSTVLGAWGYDAWGNPTSTSAPRGDSTVSTSVASAIDSAQVLRFAGYVYDSFSGLYYCSQRYYDPATAQFISPDAARADGEQSAYQYCVGDPVNRTDATGAAADWFDAGHPTAADAAINAAIHTKNRTLRAHFMHLARARAKREAKRAHARYLAEIAQERRWKAEQKAKLLVRLRAQIAASQAEAEQQAALAVACANAAVVLHWVGVAAAVAAVAITLGAGYQAAESYNEGLQAEIDAAGAETAACFPGGTPVRTAAGLVAIDAIRPGTLVLSRDERTGATSLKRVVRTMVHRATELVYIRTAADTVTATPNHPFRVAGKGWVAAGDLTRGDTLRLADGGYASIVSVTFETLGVPVDVYNLEVEDFHTYFVATTGVWVHNCGGEALSADSSAMFEPDGTLTEHARSGAERIIDGPKLNAALRNQITSDGSSIADWGKYKTTPLETLSGRWETHFYMNGANGDAFYGSDYKMNLINGR